MIKEYTTEALLFFAKVAGAFELPPRGVRQKAVLVVQLLLVLCFEKFIQQAHLKPSLSSSAATKFS